MDQRREFVSLAQANRANMRELCRRFRISPTTGYKWLDRAKQTRASPFEDQSRRPQASPQQTPQAMEAAILELRDKHSVWGGRKLAARLRELGHAGVPSPSTITAVLRRNGRLVTPEHAPHAWRHFEHPVPNQLWQMDFKGHVPLGQGHGRLHPLTVLDDHSRYCVVLAACDNERGLTVRDQLVAAFRHYGLPDGLLADNGGPWGSGQIWTKLGAWLLQLGVRLAHGRPYHPQTQGKEERFHRTLKAELLQGPPHADLSRAQRAFDQWRTVYNLERPHEACELKPPVSRYRPSDRPYPEQLPAVEYGSEYLVRRVRHHGAVSLHGRDFHISEGFAKQPLGLLPTDVDGVWTVYFSRFVIGTIDERVASDDSFGVEAYRDTDHEGDASLTNHAE